MDGFDWIAYDPEMPSRVYTGVAFPIAVPGMAICPLVGDQLDDQRC